MKINFLKISTLILFASLFGCTNKPDKEAFKTTIKLTDDKFYTFKNNNVSINFLSNDLIEGDVSIEHTSPSNGTLTFTNYNFIFEYTPNNEFIGTDFFTYTVCGDNFCETAHVLIEIKDNTQGCTDSILVQDDNLTTIQNSKLTFTKSFLLSNDKSCPNDIDLQSFSITENPQKGILTDLGDGNITYIPSSNFYGADSFKYKVCSNNNSSDCDEGTATIHILAPTNLEENK